MTSPELQTTIGTPESLHELNVLEREIYRGIEWVTLDVPDPIEEWGRQNGQSELIDQMRDMAREADEQLRDRLQWSNGRLIKQKKPETGPPDDNQYSQRIYQNEGMRDWYKLVPSARALFPLQYPLMPSLPGSDTRIDDESRKFFLYSPNSIAIRRRNTLYGEIAAPLLSQADEPLLVSLGAGLAVPSFDALAKSRPQQTIKSILVDNDPKTQALAAQYEQQVRFSNPYMDAEVDYMPADLADEMVKTDRLVNHIGPDQATFVDAVGLTEYFSDALAARFLQNAYRLVRPSRSGREESGGMLLWGNMLDDHPFLAFNQVAIRWPQIHPRSRDRLVDIIDRAGIPRQNVTAMMANDKEYAMMAVRKFE